MVRALAAFLIMTQLPVAALCASTAGRGDSKYMASAVQDKFAVDAVAAPPDEKISDGMDAAAKAGFLRVKVTLTNDGDADVATDGLRATWTSAGGAPASPATLVELYEKIAALKDPNGNPPLLLADVTNHQLSLMRIDAGTRIFGFLLFAAGAGASPAGGALRLDGLRAGKTELAAFTLVFPKIGAARRNGP
jgi:hypothetical protein